MKAPMISTFVHSKLSPILIIGYNRPDLLKITLDLIRSESRTIYISIDGPKRVADEPQVEETLKIVDVFSNSREDVKFRNFEENLGCKAHVISAIDWIFENEESAIILEDDIAFNDDFLPTMDIWLKRFQADKSVFHLNGYTPLHGELEKDEIFLSRYCYVWGWATWKDRWLMYDRDLAAYTQDKFGNLPGLNSYRLTAEFKKYWIKQLDLCNGGFDTWDTQWQFSQWVAGMYSVTPGKRMTGNLGFDGRATHTSASIHPARKIKPGTTSFAKGAYPILKQERRSEDICMQIEHGFTTDSFLIRAMKSLKHRLFLLKKRFF